MGPISRRTRLLLVAALTVAVVAAAAIQPRIPQPARYHRFADHRALLGIPNFCDVVSNLAFLVVGLWGLVFLRRQDRESPVFLTPAERWPYVVLFLGVTLTALGSAYYHLAPDNARLAWDRLPMTLGFMGILAAVIAERVSVRAGTISLLPLLALGLISVVQWRASERGGAGDLRLYLLVQFFPIFLIPLLLLFFPARYTRGGDFLLAFGFYALAKAFEFFDRAIFRATHLVSGHTLKHLTAGLAIYCLVRMLQKRRPTEGSPGATAAEPLPETTASFSRY